MTVVSSEMLVDQRLISRRERADRERSEVRARILESARHTLREGTMFDLTMQHLATDAGVSRQTIYRHFPTVQDVFRSLSDGVIDATVHQQEFDAKCMIYFSVKGQGLTDSFL